MIAKTISNLSEGTMCLHQLKFRPYVYGMSVLLPQKLQNKFT